MTNQNTNCVNMNSKRRDRPRRSLSRDFKSGIVDLRSKISTMKGKRESRDRSVSPLHSIVHKVIDKKIRRLGSESPPRRVSTDSKNDDRKSYLKYMIERSNELKRIKEEKELESRRRERSSTREDRKSRKEEKRSKKSKKSHRSDRKERKRSRERSKKRSKSKDKSRKSKEREKTRSPEEKPVHNDAGHQQEPLQSEQTEDQKENNGINVGESTNVETDKQTKEIEVKEDTKIDDMEEDDFDDFIEAELSSLSSSSLSLSSVEEVPERVISPLGSWNTNGFHRNTRLSGSPPMPPRERSHSRSRSRSRPYDHPKSKSRSISPPPYLSTSTWESRVSEFVRSIGGVSNRSPSSTFLESIPSTSNQPPMVLNFPPPPVISFAQVPAIVNVPPPFLVGPRPDSLNLSVPPPTPSTLQSRTAITQSGGPMSNGFFHQNPDNKVKANQLQHQVPLQKRPPSPDEEESQPEEITLTPLIKFIGQKLADKKLTNLMSLRKGFFRYNLLSVASR